MKRGSGGRGGEEKRGRCRGGELKFAVSKGSRGSFNMQIVEKAASSGPTSSGIPRETRGNLLEIRHKFRPRFECIRST